ncbi:hypothetical protein BGZ65_005203 [Modicella reniformis]|uniref:Uncharacterized protein n=1 Tax=Modicella reniformis TaxID=1440133 RepID=A0A9P6M2J7_9FUNG|nr:hypothetical protein BGZ65_005203 [Modicella reniformis]
MQDPSEEIFALLRGPASRLLRQHSIGASNAHEVAQDLEAVHGVIKDITEPELHLDENLIKYIQFTLDHVMLRCGLFKIPEKRFDFLVDAWCKCVEFILLLPIGYASMMGTDWRYSLMLLDVLLRAVGGLFPQERHKGTLSLPTDKMQDEVRLSALRCLIIAIPLDRLAHLKPMDHFDASDTLSDKEEMADNIGMHVGDNKDEDSKEQHTDGSKERETWKHLMDPSNDTIIAQLIVILLEVAKDANLVVLRGTALDGVMKVLKCLKTPQRVAKWLPGIAVGLAEAMMERGLKEHHNVLVKALKIWTLMIVLGLKDPVHAEQPIEEAMSRGASFSDALMGMYKAKLPSTSEPQTVAGTTQQRSSDGCGTEARVKEAESKLQKLFRELSALHAHSHWMVRFEFGRMAFNILKDCQSSITHRISGSYSSGFASILLEILVGCTQDEYKEVCKPARMFLEQLTTEFRSMDLTAVGKEIMREKLMTLPRILYGVDETAKQNSIRTAQGMALFLGTQMGSIINHHSIINYARQWINVLSIEQLDQHSMDERGGILDVESDLADSESISEKEHWRAWVQSRKGLDRKFGFPRRIHQHLREHSTSCLFTTFLRQVGSVTEISVWGDELISRLQQDSRSVREGQGWYDGGSVSCVLMMNQLLLGASRTGVATYGDSSSATAGTKSHKRRHQRHVRRVTKGILEEYLAVMAECSQMVLDARSRQEGYQQSAHSADVGVEARKVALARFFDTDDDGLSRGQPEASVYDYKTDVLLQCLLLEGIACIAVILGASEFELELVRVLYILLERLGDPDSALVRDTAEATLEHVAFVCGYDSVGVLVQANYDYVIQQVSQRIAFLSSNPKTPQVLSSLIRVVGPPAITMLEDSVTEIFDALDHWKSQEDQVGEGLLKSLSEIVKVMAQASSTLASNQDEPAIESKHDSGVIVDMDFRPSYPDKRSVEVTQFAEAYRILIQGADTADEETEKLKKEIKNMTREQIQVYFMSLAKDTKGREESFFGEREEGHVDDLSGSTLGQEDDDESFFGDMRASMPQPPKEAPVPPTKHQALCLRILDKAGYFLTASSPRLRILALEIIQSSVLVLKDRPQELHPAIHAFWPSLVERVLKRSDMEVFYVSQRAIEIVTLLAENCSDFLRRHFLDDIWPYILKVLQMWTRKPTRNVTRNLLKGGYSEAIPSVSKQRSQGRQGSPAKVFTMEHRLQMTTLESVAKIVRKMWIPVQQIWEMLLLARDIMLNWSQVLHWEVRMAAVEVIRSMAIAGHGDCVFVALDEVVHDSKKGNENDSEEDVGKQLCLDILAFMDLEVL